jgi:hypothetical protein
MKNDYWVVRDGIESQGDHQVALSFHFNAGLEPKLRVSDEMEQEIEENNGQKCLKIATFYQPGGWRKEDGLVSHCYGHEDRAPVFVYSTSTKGAAELVTFLLPQAAEAVVPFSVKEVEAIGGHAFEVALGQYVDVVMIRDSARQHVETAALASDFEWTWARFSKESPSAPDELVLLGGQALQLEGKEVLKSQRRINHLVARRVGDQFRLETEDGILELSLPVKDFDSEFAKQNQKSEI